MPPAAENRVSFDTIAIVGVGLLGGSIAAAIKTNRIAERVIGIGRNQARLDAAQDAGIIDSSATSFEVGASELVVVCTPVDLIVDGIRQAADSAQPGTLITDVGSTKGNICNAINNTLPDGITFIGSHPIAGSEKHGHEHSNAKLLKNSVCVITPDDSTPAEQIVRLKSFWSQLGSSVVELTPEDHDRVLAETSHLPHAVAASLAASLNESNRQFAGTGFRDTTRIAAGNPDLWTAIFLNNVDAVLDSLDTFQGQLSSLRTAIENRDNETLQNLLSNARTIRDELS